MTTPVSERRGFEVKNVFYEYVPLNDWFNRDFVLARTITRVGVDELVSGRADYIAVQQALFAVAVWHTNPDQQMDRIITFVDGIKPANINEIGFAADGEDTDARPPDESSSAKPSNSPETGENSSESS